MTIETRAYICRLARTGMGILMGVLLVCGTAEGQAPAVTTGSVVTIPSDSSWGQIYKILFYNGNVLALDTGNSALYQLSPGATSWSTLVSAAGGSTMLGKAGSFNSDGMTIDAQGTLYIGIRYQNSAAPSALFWRVPYNAAGNTWNPTTSNGWGSNIVDSTGSTPTAVETESYSDDVEFVNSPKMDGSGTLYWIGEASNVIYSAPVDNQGDVELASVPVTFIVNSLEADQGKMAVDVNGNIYFVENHAVKNTGRATGVFFIPAGTTGITGAGGSAEAQLQRIDASNTGANPIVYSGVTLDEAGNLYLTSEQNSTYDETINGVWMVPNECGGPSKVTSAACLNYSHTSLVAPVGSNNPMAIDSRGYDWIPTYQDWNPAGSGPFPGVYGIVVWAPGSLNLSSEPTGTTTPWITNLNPVFGNVGASVTITGLNFGSTQGTSTVSFNGTAAASIGNWSDTSITAVVPAGATTGPVVVTANGVTSNSVAFTVGAAPVVSGAIGTLFDNFNATVTPSAFPISQIGSGSDFVNVQTNPNPASPPAATSPQCSATMIYTSQATCQIWVGLNARAPGAVSGELTISGTVGTSTQNEFVSGSTVYLSGTGQGAEAALLESPLETTITAALQTPQQVAADPLGDTYIADSGLKKVLCFGTYCTASSIGTGLAGPTGVAADESGDVYIADSGKVIEVPATNGVPVAANQTTIASGFGKNLNLAVDGLGDVYVADPNNARVVKIPNPATAQLIPNGNTAGVNASTIVTVGSGFKSPSAVAVDNAGDLFVADGANLYEVTPWSVQTDITSSLTTVTGLAVDASGSVVVSQSGGLLRIPSISGTLQVNSAGPIAGNLTNPITAPNGVALDQSGNIYVSDVTGGTPNLFELAVGGLINPVDGFINFGDGLTPTLLAVQDVPLFDIGNEPLTVTGVPVFSGSVASDFSVVPPSGGTACDTTGVNSVSTGSSCTLGLGFTPPAPPPGDTTPITYTGGMTVPTNAGNVPSGTVTANLQATALAGQEPTQTTVSLTPATSTYPGSTTATVTVTPEPGGGIDYPNSVPSGTVTLTLTSTAVGSTQPPLVKTAQATGTTAGTTATFTLTGIQGGPYSVTAVYAGNIAQLMQGSTSSAVTFTVAPALPTITLSEPLGVSANSANGIYYVQDKQATITLTANVTSLLGTPTGTVTFMNGSQVVGTETPDANGNAVFPTNNLADGSYNLTAVYSGDQNFAQVTSKVIAFQVIPSSVLITASPTTVSTPAGTPVSSTITLQSLAGFSAPNGANLVCDNSTLPYYSECTFSVPEPVICAPPGLATNPCSGILTSVLTISSNIPVNLPPATAANVRVHGSGTSPLIPAGLFGFGLFGLALRRRAIFNRKLLNGASLGLLLMGVVMGFGGCTNNSYTKTPLAQKYTTPSGTYKVSILVTNSASGVTESLPFTLGVTIQ